MAESICPINQKTSNNKRLTLAKKIRLKKKEKEGIAISPEAIRRD